MANRERALTFSVERLKQMALATDSPLGVS